MSNSSAIRSDIASRASSGCTVSKGACKPQAERQPAPTSSSFRSPSARKPIPLRELSDRQLNRRERVSRPWAYGSHLPVPKLHCRLRRRGCQENRSNSGSPVDSWTTTFAAMRDCCLSRTESPG